MILWPACPRHALQREAEKAKQREKEEKEEAIYRAQEELEEKLKFITEKVPTRIMNSQKTGVM